MTNRKHHNITPSLSDDLLCVEIDSYSSLESDWDSYGARPIEARAIELAKMFVKNTDLPWQSVPTPEGGVQLEVHDNGLDIEIDIKVST